MKTLSLYSKLFVFCIMTNFYANNAFAESNHLIFAVPNYPPFSSFGETGEVEGIAIDVIKDVYAEMGMPIKILLLPWKRAKRELEIEKIHGIFPCGIRQQNNLNRYAVSTVLFEEKVILVGRYPHEETISSLDQLREKEGDNISFATPLGYSVKVMLTNAGFNDIHDIKGEKSGLKMLLNNRIDYLLTGLYVFEKIAKESFPDQKFEIITLKEFDLGMCFSKTKIDDDHIFKFNTTFYNLNLGN